MGLDSIPTIDSHTLIPSFTVVKMKIIVLFITFWLDSIHHRHNNCNDFFVAWLIKGKCKQKGNACERVSSYRVIMWNLDYESRDENKLDNTFIVCPWAENRQIDM